MLSFHLLAKDSVISRVFFITTNLEMHFHSSPLFQLESNEIFAIAMLSIVMYREKLNKNREHLLDLGDAKAIYCNANAFRYLASCISHAMMHRGEL